ncbi:MAG: DNA repair exonuclease [Oscillibacter sp.]|nr:DNA repair exonuclease [Oscillibacter sp.]
MIKFIHSADWHLDSPFSGLGAKEAAQRRKELRQVPQRLADYVNEQGVGLVLLAGDLFDGKHVYRETMEALTAALGRMRAKVLISPGNHDCWGPMWDKWEWPDNVYIFRQARLTALELGDVVFHGGAFITSEQGSSLLSGFKAPEDGKLHIGLLHGEVAAESCYDPIRPGDIAASNLDYLALGHIHKRGEARYGKTLAAWPGCIEGRGFDETGEKGFYEGVIDDDGSVSIAFVPFAKRKYEILTVDVTGKDPLAAVEEALPRETEQDLCRILLTGEAETVPDIETALRRRFYALEVRDHTRVPRDIWERAGEDSLRGLFLRKLREQLESAKTEEEREKVTAAARFGLAALEGRDLS